MNSNLLSPEDIVRLSAIVKELTGNQVLEKNHSMLESRLRARLIKLGLNDTKDYWRYYSENEQTERHVLQGLMTTHYTFFFREYVHFEALESWIESNASLLKARFAKEQKPVRVWSAACSRGQEVYSLAMFLEFILVKKHGIPYEIIGSDIDAESVEYARNGVYPLKEVNTIPHHYLNEFWKKGTGEIKDFAAVHPKIRQKTQLQQTNLLEPKTFPANKFDVIFCRNVLIYFSEDNVKKIALALKDKLEDHGLFVSGVSESLRFPEWTMASIAPSCYTKVDLTSKPVTKTDGTPEPVSITKAAHYKVLCVDDSPTIQTLLKKIFSTDPNCQGVTPAVNGQDAREKLNSGNFDVITLDIHMPVMGGIEFLETQYKKSIDPPVIMVSSVNRTDLDLATKSLRLGAFDYVEKPAMNNLQKSIDEIITKVRSAIKSGTKAASTPGSENFENSIGQKIIIPDASTCLRWVKLGSAQVFELEPIFMHLKKEERSPAIVICAPQSRIGTLENSILSWSGKKPQALSEPRAFLKPNEIYLCSDEHESAIVEALQVKTVSLQIIGRSEASLAFFKKFSLLQLLISEDLTQQSLSISEVSSLHVSDITPVTSFISLSVEFFANLRKAA